MISLEPKELAGLYLKKNGYYPDPSVYEVRDFVKRHEVKTGESFVSFEDINSYFILLTEDTHKEVLKQLEEHYKPKAKGKTKADIDSEIKDLLNQKDNRLIFRIDKWTKFLGVDIKTLRVFIGYSHKSRRLLGISTLEIGTYHCFSDEDSIYLPVQYLQQFLKDVERQAGPKKIKRIAHVFQRALDPLYDLQKEIEKATYPIHDMKRFNNVREAVKKKMLSQLKGGK